VICAVKTGTVVTLAIVLLVAGTAEAASILDVTEVADLVTTSILPELAISADYIAFTHPQLLDVNDELAPYAPSSIPADVNQLPYLVPYDLDDPTWLVWIDLQPYARYAHETLFVLVDAINGSYVIHEEMWWPVLNGESLWVDQTSYWAEENWIASSLSGSIPTGDSLASCVPDVPGSDYYDWALIINGWSPGEPGEEGFSADARGMCEALNTLGMRVSILDAGAASPEALEAHVIRLFTEIPLYMCCDRLYFYITCHSSPGALWIGGLRLSSTELARMLTLPGDTYVPSRVYVMLEAGYGGSFIPALSPHSNINRVWTASAANEPAIADLDPQTDPNLEDAGGEWTSSFLATMAQLLRDDPLAIQATEFSREYMPLNMAYDSLGPVNAAMLEDLSHPASYLFSDSDPEGLLEDVAYLARWDRAYHLNEGNLEETIALYEHAPYMELIWFLNNMARHDSLPRPSPEFNERVGKGAAKNLAHSDWWKLCDYFWSIFTTPVEGE
jgi:hypothetical protein